MQIVIICLLNFLLGFSVFPVKSQQAVVPNRHYTVDECFPCIAIGNENTPTAIQTGLYGLTSTFSLTTREVEIRQRLDTSKASNPEVKYLGFAISHQDNFSPAAVFGVMPYSVAGYPAQHIPGIIEENGELVGRYLINIVPMDGFLTVNVRDRVVCQTEVRSRHNCYMDSPNMRHPPTIPYKGSGHFAINMDKINVRYSKPNRLFSIEFSDPLMRIRRKDQYSNPQFENSCGISPHYYIKFLGATPYTLLRPIVHTHRFDADITQDEQPKQIINLPEIAHQQLVNAPTIAKKLWPHVKDDALKNQFSIVYCYCERNEKKCTEPGFRDIDDIDL